jgi:hypothetical protein
MLASAFDYLNPIVLPPLIVDMRVVLVMEVLMVFTSTS